MKKILVSLPDNLHTFLSGRDVSMSELIRSALVQYLDLDPLTFEPKGINPKPTPPFDSLPFMEQRRIMDEFTAERNKTHPDQYCYGVVDTPAGYLPQYADMDPAD